MEALDERMKVNDERMKVNDERHNEKLHPEQTEERMIELDESHKSFDSVLNTVRTP
jgi:hypothetical protein